MSQKTTCDGCGKSLNPQGDDYNKVIVRSKDADKKAYDFCDNCLKNRFG